MCSGFVSLFFAAFNIFYSDFALLGYLEVALLLFCIYTFYRLNNHSVESWHSYVMCIIVTSVVVLGGYLAKGYVFRVGGEEFALYHSFNTQSEALSTAENIRSKLNSTAFDIAGLKINVTASVGVTKYHHGDTLEKFVAKADKQLYLAKENGRNNVYFKSIAYFRENIGLV